MRTYLLLALAVLTLQSSTLKADPAITTAPATTATAPATLSMTLTPADKLAEVQHQITLNQQTLAYKSTTGYLPLKDETGKTRANIFFVAYTKNTPPLTSPPPTTTQPVAKTQPTSNLRPITFVFNGGPGSASAWLHLGTVGPYKIATPEDASIPAPPGKLVENPYTWLTDTDLVFIDPVGTGYSRAQSPEQNKEYYGVSEDVAAVAEFIRLYTTRYQRWTSPKFLAGESYGTTRAAALSEYLHDQKGLDLNGIILISSVLNFASISPSEGNDLPYALFLPSYTAAAFYHQKLSAELQKDLPGTLAAVEKFTLNTYIPALAKGASLSEAETQGLAEQLARFTGLPASVITQNHLRIDPPYFEKSLLNTEPNPRIIGRMDSRMTAFTADPADRSHPDFDPALSGYLPLYTAAFNAYVRDQLHYENELPYDLLSNRVGPWNFGGNGASGYLYVGDNLRNTLQKNPKLQVLVASGYFDLATPYFATDYTLSHLNLPAPLRENIHATYYPGGHMMYHEKSSADELHKQVSKFITKALER